MDRATTNWQTGTWMPTCLASLLGFPMGYFSIIKPLNPSSNYKPAILGLLCLRPYAAP
jgi:hypothetical protein